MAWEVIAIATPVLKQEVAVCIPACSARVPACPLILALWIDVVLRARLLAKRAARTAPVDL